MKNISCAKWIKNPFKAVADIEEFTEKYTSATESQTSWLSNPLAVNKGEDVFFTDFKTAGEVKSATLEVTALGVYEAKINGKRVGDFILAPGWTTYNDRLQVQEYDVTAMLGEENRIEIGVASGWKACAWAKYAFDFLGKLETAMLCALTIDYADGSSQTVTSGPDWKCREGDTVYSDLYNGCIIDLTKEYTETKVAAIQLDNKILIDTEGEKITEHEIYPAQQIIITPKGETVIDFGYNQAGYVEFKIKGRKGEKVVVQHAETLDKDGNFYRDNLRAAKAEIVVICDGEEHTIKPAYNFYGFRYIKLTGFSDEIKKENFNFITLYSDMKRTGYFECSDERVNKLYNNAIRSQRSNFIDVPTDCPQRDERLGWTGDAQVFVKTASYNYDVNRFFEKWLADLRTDQTGWGTVPAVIPNVFGPDQHCSAAWADAATVCPTQMYLTYANKELLQKSLDSMKGYLDYINSWTKDGIWADTPHFGDWLNLDEKEGGTAKNLIATAWFVYSLTLYINAIKICGETENVAEYEEKKARSIEAFRREYMDGALIKEDYATQTACVLACQFGITPDVAKTAEQLNGLVTECGHLKTGFVGTPFLLHVLSDNGYIKTAYDLLLREEYPSWLFEVKVGATTIWEHWDSLNEQGEMWDTGMNSFNHYAYGSVCDWLYENAAGIKPDPEKPGFEHIIFAPLTDERLDYVKASIETKYGKTSSEWTRENGAVTYRFTVPEGASATIKIGDTVREVSAGEYKMTE